MAMFKKVSVLTLLTTAVVGQDGMLDWDEKHVDVD
jgi:hypothetical protein